MLLAGDVVTADGVDLPALLIEQLAFQWERLTRPRLDGLTDREYFGEPVPDCLVTDGLAVTTSPLGLWWRSCSTAEP